MLNNQERKVRGWYNLNASFCGFKISLKKEVSLSFIPKICVGIKYPALFSRRVLSVCPTKWKALATGGCCCEYFLFAGFVSAASERFIFFQLGLRFIWVSWQPFSSYLTKGQWNYYTPVVSQKIAILLIFFPMELQREQISNQPPIFTLEHKGQFYYKLKTIIHLRWINMELTVMCLH